MSGLWSSLLPLAVGSAVVPVQLIITLLLLRSASGRTTAVAWVAGMVAVRVAQGAIFGLVLSGSDAAAADDGGGPGTIVSTLLLVMAVLMYATALKQYRTEEDPDGPPPRWLTMTESLTPLKAFGLGAAVLAVGAKFWVFTLSAIAAIGDADLGQPEAAVAFAGFVLGTASIHLAILGFAYLAPSRSAATLDRAAAWLTDASRVIVIVLGLVFGTWFLVKALSGLGVV